MLAKLVNLSLLGLFPLAWMAPLASTEVAWLFTVEEISILSGVRELYDIDLFLAGAVAIFAIVIPYVKTVALVYAQFSPRQDAKRILPFLEILGRLSMADIFLIALSILVYRGIGEIQVAWGFYFFMGLVLASIFSAWATMRARFVRMPREEADALRAAAAAGTSEKDGASAGRLPGVREGGPLRLSFGADRPGPGRDGAA